MPGPIRARARFAIASFTLALALSACGDDDPTGPVDVDIVGDWVMDVTGTDSAGLTCQISDITLSFVRNNNVVEGIMVGGGAGTIVCAGVSGTNSLSGSPALEDLVENGQNVEFTAAWASGTWLVSGAFTGNDSVSGDVTFYLTFTSGLLEFNGSWTATRS